MSCDTSNWYICLSVCLHCFFTPVYFTVDIFWIVCGLKSEREIKISNVLIGIAAIFVVLVSLHTEWI